MRSLLSELRQPIRALSKAPAFTTVAIVTIALGIGANTAVFSVLNAVFLRSLPFPQPERLMMVWEATSMFKLRYSPPSLANYVSWRAQNNAFEEMGALEGASFTVSGVGVPEQVRGVIATASVLRALRVAPAIGRSFLESEDKPGSPHVAIISHGLWQRRLGSRSDLASATLRINGQSVPVVGVLPRDFRFPEDDIDIWMPAGAAYSAGQYENRGWHNHAVVARLKPGIELRQANENLAAIAKQLEAEYPKTNKDLGAFASPMREHMTGNAERFLPLLLGAVGLLLLIACANVASLLLSRALARRREIAVRMSIGAGTWAVTRQLTIEHLVLAFAGGAAGLLVATWCFSFLESLIPPSIRAMTELSLDMRVLAFTGLLCLGAALVFGVAPVLQALRTDIQSALKNGDERAGSAREAHRMQAGLVVGQVALAVVLLIGAGLLIRSFAALRAVDPGIRSENLLLMRMLPAGPKYKEAPARHKLYEEVLGRIRSIPGVVSAAATTGAPLSFKGWFVGFTPEGQESDETVNFRVITPDYFRTAGMPLRLGRNLGESDRENAPPAAIVNETLANRYWPGENPIGKRFTYSDRQLTTIVGVVADVRQAGLDVPPRPEIYLPFRQQESYPAEIVVRTAVDPASLVATIRREIASVDPEQAVTRVRTMDEVIDLETEGQKTRMLLFGSFAVLAVLLAAVGVYGVLSFSVARRTPEIGIRMALGAQSRSILKHVLGRGARLLFAGAVVGLLLSVAVTRLFSQVLFGVTALDPASFGAGAALIMAVGVVAAYVPARRAMKTDPLQALRNGQ